MPAQIQYRNPPGTEMRREEKMARIVRARARNPASERTARCLLSTTTRCVSLTFQRMRCGYRMEATSWREKEFQGIKPAGRKEQPTFPSPPPPRPFPPSRYRSALPGHRARI